MKTGDPVRFTGSIEHLLAGLPAEEARAIRAGMGARSFRLTRLMADGKAEIELALEAEAHFFYVGVNDIVPHSGEGA